MTTAIVDTEEFAQKLKAAALAAEKKANLTPVFLRRDSFASTAISTGSLCLDYILGGGIPPSRIVGIAGPERSGKTLIATEITSNHLKSKGFSVYLDAEGSNDPLFLKSRGIDFDKYRGKRNKKGDLKKEDVDHIHFYQPATVEQIADYMHTFMGAMPEDRNPDSPRILFTLDSVVALVSDALSEDLDSNKMAMHARAYSQYLPIINSALIRAGCTLVYTNQLRQKPGVQYGSPLYEPAGDALKFFSSIRLQLSQTKPKAKGNDHPFLSKVVAPGVEPKQGGNWYEPHYDENGVEIGQDVYNYTAVRTIKNRLYNPYQVCYIRIQSRENGATGRGLDKVFDVFTFLYEHNYIIKPFKTKGDFELAKDMPYDVAKKTKMPDKFTYKDFKIWVNQNPGVVEKLRKDLLVSGLIYNYD